MKKNVKAFVALFLAGVAFLVAACKTEVADTTAPGMVSLDENDVIAANGKATLTWTNPVDEDFYATRVTVEPAVESGNSSLVIEGKPGQKSIASFEGLTNGTEYTFKLYTLDNNHNVSDAVEVKATPLDTSDKTAPGEVSELSVACVNGTDDKVNVIFSWTDPTDTDGDLFGIEITYVNAEQATSRAAFSAMSKDSIFVAPGKQSAVISDLSAGTTYTFTVKTMDTSGNKSEGVSKEISAGQIYIFDVGNFTLSSEDNAINLAWENPDDGDFCKTVIKIDCEENTSIVELDSFFESFSFTSGQLGKSYDFTVYAVNKSGFYSTGVTDSSIFVDVGLEQFENPVMLVTLPAGIDDITTKTWLEDQELDLAQCKIIDNQNSENNADFAMDIKGRGNSSWSMPKKSYSVKLDKKANLFDMANGKHKSYALIANYCDKTLLRNQLAYYLGNEIFDNMEWNPHTRQVNLFVNGKYYGIYLLTERIKIDKQIVNIKDVSDVSDFSEGGWIIEVNKRLDETYNWTTTNGVCISLKDPDDYEDWEKIQDYINSVEDVLFGENYTDPENGWRKYLDEDSFIDWYLVNEIARNPDAANFSSIYMYFDPSDSKIHMGPLWDFDIGFGNTNQFVTTPSTEGFLIKYGFWNNRLFTDKNFVAAVKERWAEKKDLLNVISGATEDSSMQITTISDFGDILSSDAELNFTRWPILGTYVWRNPDGYEDRRTYQSEVDYLKDWLTKRITWFDTALNSL